MSRKDLVIGVLIVVVLVSNVYVLPKYSYSLKEKEELLNTEKDINNKLVDEIRRQEKEINILKQELDKINKIIEEKDKEIKLLSEKKVEHVSRGSFSRNVPQHNNFKSYMDFRAITNKNSKQYQLQQKAYTENGFRKYDNRYLVALGSHWGKVGDKVDIKLSSGVVLNCIIGDQKADNHTDKNNIIHLSDGSVIEFIIDKKTLSRRILRMGDCSYAEHEDFSGAVESIIRR